MRKSVKALFRRRSRPPSIDLARSDPGPQRPPTATSVAAAAAGEVKGRDGGRSPRSSESDGGGFPSPSSCGGGSSSPRDGRWANAVDDPFRLDSSSEDDHSSEGGGAARRA